MIRRDGSTRALAPDFMGERRNAMISSL